MHHVGGRRHGRHGPGADWEDGRGGRGEGRSGRRRVFESTELRLVLLKLIADQPRHGYDLIRAVEDLTGGAYAPSPGVIYPTLTMLEEMGQIEKLGSDGARKEFTITQDGRVQLAGEMETVEGLFARLAALARKREKVDAAPIRRAMDNLKAVLMHRLGRETVETETLHAVAAILDEAAQRIERLP
ncbi:PadR family transcriptional regulator (plasmid) [Azospirillum thermophilum]|uniref:PadR family transcriptional regulator n=2 Tax=Azospirillum thermophilum TaxID=2202148 RepID=A0A2S2CZ79_9PROT|nr:PadR family transcriptional regulator [Azospirillum thermophilum]